MTHAPPSAIRRDITADFADFAAGLTYEALPVEAVELAKALVLDSSGAMLAATTLAPACAPVVIDALAQPDPDGCLVFGHGVRAAPLVAARANGALVHALNLDAAGSGHAGLVLPAILAASHTADDRSGKALITAVVAAAELVVRAHRAARAAEPRAELDVLEGQLIGYFACALGCARAFRLGAPVARSALGLALMQAAGSPQLVLEGDPPAKSVFGAFPNHAGLLSAQLAARGLDAGCDALAGERGLLALLGVPPEQRAALVGDLGVEFACEHIRFKRWAASGKLDAVIECGRALRRERAFEPRDIAAVRLVVGSGLRPWTEPAERRQRPSSVASATNSAQFLLATALLHGGVPLERLRADRLSDPGGCVVAARVRVEIDDTLGADAMVEVRTRDGSSLACRCSPRRATRTREDLTSKFGECCAQAAQPVTATARDRYCDAVWNLDAIDDVRSLSGYLCGARGTAAVRPGVRRDE